MDKSVQITLIVVIGVVLLGIVGLSVYQSTNSLGKDTVSVNGVSNIEVSPDLVSIYFTIQTKGTTSKEATDSNNEIYNELKSSLMNSGFTESEIQTQSFNVQPNYIYSNSQRKQDGFLATHSIIIKFPTGDTEKISNAIDSGTNANATISYISFELSPALESTYKAQAIENASKDARTKAEAVASGLNKKVGDLVSVNVDNYVYYPVRTYDAATSSSSSSAEIKQAAEITPSKQTVSASVTAVFKIK